MRRVISKEESVQCSDNLVQPPRAIFQLQHLSCFTHEQKIKNTRQISYRQLQTEQLSSYKTCVMIDSILCRRGLWLSLLYIVLLMYLINFSNIAAYDTWTLPAHIATRTHIAATWYFVFFFSFSLSNLIGSGKKEHRWFLYVIPFNNYNLNYIIIRSYTYGALDYVDVISRYF